jgi:hypothetical protein
LEGIALRLAEIAFYRHAVTAGAQADNLFEYVAEVALVCEA